MILEIFFISKIISLGQLFTGEVLRHFLNLRNCREMLIFIQDESIDIGRRVRESLDGEYKCSGIGKNIVTALLHTFNPNKYGVWNTKTDKTLKAIGRMPIMTSDIGKNYVAINEKLKALAIELKTDLATIDGFMWFVSSD